MTQVEAAADASAGGATADRGRLVQLIVAAVLMGVTGVMLVGTGVWALTFMGAMSRELRRALNGHTLTGFPSNRGDFVIRILFLLPVLP